MSARLVVLESSDRCLTMGNRGMGIRAVTRVSGAGTKRGGLTKLAPGRNPRAPSAKSGEICRPEKTRHGRSHAFERSVFSAKSAASREHHP